MTAGGLRARLTEDLGPPLFARWAAGGKLGAFVQESGGNELELTQTDARLEGLALAPGETFPITLTFIPKLEGTGAPPTPAAESYAVDVIHRLGTGELATIVGGQRLGVRTRVPAPVPDL